MTGKLPRAGQRITVRWPGGPHNFKMIYRGEGDPSPHPGWHFLYGEIVSPPNWWPRLWAPMAHLVDGEWTMLPKGGKFSDVEPPASQ